MINSTLQYKNMIVPKKNAAKHKKNKIHENLSDDFELVSDQDNDAKEEIIDVENNNSGIFEVVVPKKKKVLNITQPTTILNSDIVVSLTNEKKMKPTHNLPWTEKYRPKKLDDVVHQDKVIAIFREAIGEHNKPLPHMILFGPPGTGKTSAILAASKELFTQDVYRQRVLEFNASDDRGIDFIKQTITNYAEAVASSSQGPSYKIIILDEADFLTKDAQSALRVIIEENSKNTRFVLICNYIHQITGQILSRCTKFRFIPISDNLVYDKLNDIARRERLIPHINDDVIPCIVSVINGDLRKGITLLQQCITLKEIHKRVSQKHILDIMGIMDIRELKNLLSECTSMLATIKIVNTIIRSGYSIPFVLEHMIDIILSDDTISDKQKAKLCLELAQSEKRMIECADESLQLTKIFTSYYMIKK
jgi:replication factor C subunit 2/4